jgi:hypothetical protein
MTPETVFLICNYGILPVWALLVIAPKSPWTRWIVHSPLVPVLFALVYIWAFIGDTAGAPGGSFFTLAGVMNLFASPWIALAGWLHYLVFDLFIGAWEARDAERRSVPRFLVVPCLLVTLVVGPVGLGLYLLLRMLLAKGFFLAEAEPQAVTPDVALAGSTAGRPIEAAPLGQEPLGEHRVQVE